MLYHFSELHCLQLKTGAPLTQFVLREPRSALVCRQRAGVGGRTPVDPNENSSLQLSIDPPMRRSIGRVSPNPNDMMSRVSQDAVRKDSSPS
jgi:hypothetical protein